ncbi:MAG: hypothetical protein QXF56_05265 [Candidatus Micrarchaeia archaeon]
MRRIKACSLCGSLKIKPASLSEGGVPGASEIAGVYWCSTCGKKVPSAVFKSINEYKKFLRGIHR